MAPSPVPQPAQPPLLLLGRALLWRLCAGTAAVVVALAAADWLAWRDRLAAELPPTARLAAQLLEDDLRRRAAAFNRHELTATLAPLAGLAERAPLCAEIQHSHVHRVVAECLPHEADSPSPDDGAFAIAARWLADGDAPRWTRQLPLTLPEGVKVGDLQVRPHWAEAGRALAGRWARLGTAGLLLMAVLWAASRLVARALAPANLILSQLQKLAAGSLDARVPPLRLRELHRIGEGFNQVAREWAAAREQQQQLAHHLLQARETERRHLARELHDEMGQCLAALQAEAAAMQLLTATALPQAAASATAMARTTAQLLEGLQRVLADLRPQALDRFGVAAALQALCSQPRRRADGSTLQVRLTLPADGPLPTGEDDVQVYRIVQEGLTNCLRHGNARHAQVTLTRDGERLHLCIDDDGTGLRETPVPGHGLIGLQERVQALGGSAAWQPSATGGLQLRVVLPLEAPR